MWQAFKAFDTPVNTYEFVKHLREKYIGKKIILIWDGASYHRFGEFRDYLEKLNHGISPEKWLVTCVLFAPNAPQQNPIEDVWLQAKYFRRKYWHLCKSFQAVNSRCRSQGEVRFTINKELFAQKAHHAAHVTHAAITWGTDFTAQIEELIISI